MLVEGLYSFQKSKQHRDGVGFFSFFVYNSVNQIIGPGTSLKI